MALNYYNPTDPLNLNGAHSMNDPFTIKIAGIPALSNVNSVIPTDQQKEEEERKRKEEEEKLKKELEEADKKESLNTNNSDTISNTTSNTNNGADSLMLMSAPIDSTGMLSYDSINNKQSLLNIEKNKEEQKDKVEDDYKKYQNQQVNIILEIFNQGKDPNKTWLDSSIYALNNGVELTEEEKELDILLLHSSFPSGLARISIENSYKLILENVLAKENFETGAQLFQNITKEIWEEEEDYSKEGLIYLKSKEYYVDTEKLLTLEEFDATWDDLSADDKFDTILNVIANKALAPLEAYYYEEYIRDPTDKYDFLCLVLSSNPYYKSMGEKIEKEANSLNEAINSDNWLTRGIQVNLDRFVRGWNNLWTEGVSLDNAGDAFTGGLKSVAGGGLKLLGNIGGALYNSGVNIVNGRGTWDDIDAAIRRRADAYVQRLVEPKLEYFHNNADLETKDKVVKAIKDLSKDENVGSSYFKLHEDDDYVKNITDDLLIAEFFKLRERANLVGDQAAIRGLQNFWQDSIASQQTKGEKIINTGALFINTATADIAAFAAVIINPVYLIWDNEGNINVEGYSDALLKRNKLLDWATGLQETGCWTFELQAKYKALGLNLDAIYKTVDEENSYLTWNDLGDIIGQYGFTAATMLLSFGGSAAIRGITTTGARMAMSNGVKGKIARGIVWSKASRNAIKAGLKSGATAAEITKAMETTTQIASKFLHRANLAWTGILGTSEGALEANTTFHRALKEYSELVDRAYAERKAGLEKASRAQLRNYMLAKGMQPTEAIEPSDGSGTVILDFTDEQYDLAYAELYQHIVTSKKQELLRAEDNALDAGYVNFINNSFINGMLNVFGKDLMMSKDARQAIRNMGNGKKLEDLIDVSRGTDGKYHATIKKSVQEAKAKSWWGATKEAWTNEGFKNKMKGLAHVFKESPLGKMSKQALAEATEEYLQGESDMVARAMFEHDLKAYMDTVYDPKARDQFMTDWLGLVSVGTTTFIDNIDNKEHIKAAIYGGLSTLLGGGSPASFIQKFQTTSSDIENATTKLEKFKAHSKLILKNLSNLYDGGIRLALNAQREDFNYAQLMQESVERWLTDSKHQELIEHMGGAVGFANSVQTSTLMGDGFLSRNDLLALAVENIIMMNLFKGTKMYEEYQATINDRIALSQLSQSGEVNYIFDDNGKFIDQALLDDQYTVTINEQEVTVAQAAEKIASLISQFRNASSDNMQASLTDQQVLERIIKNAQEVKDLENRVEKATSTIETIFHKQDLDPLVKSAYVHAMLSQQDTRRRRESLEERLKRGMTPSETSTLTDEQKEKLNKRQGKVLNEEGINLVIEYGSIENAIKAIERIKKEINKHYEDSKSGETKEDRQYAKQAHKRAVARLNLLLSRLKAAEITVTENEQKNTEEVPGVEVIPVESLSKPKDAQPMIQIRDLVEMSVELRYMVLNHREKFSAEQNAIIDEFIDIVRSNVASQTNDMALSNEEIINDFNDLFKLSQRSGAYDKLLLEYINKPHFLNDYAARLRYKERKRVLRALYQEDLKLRDDETPLDMVDRIELKIKDLKDRGKIQDAQILLSLLEEDENIAKLRNTIFDIRKLSILIGGIRPKAVDSEEFKRAIVALNTIASVSGLTLEEIYDLFKSLNTDKIKLYLGGQMRNGDHIFNRYLEEAGLDVIGNLDNFNFDPIIQTVKDYLDAYFNLVNSTGNKGNTVVGPSGGTTNTNGYTGPPNGGKEGGTEGGTENDGGNEGGGTQVNVNGENATIKILSPGEIDTSTAEGKAILLFLKEKHASIALMNYNNSLGNAHVFFMVSKLFGKPVVFTVLLTKAKTQHSIEIDGKYYQVIGVANKQDSKILNDLATKTFTNMQNDNAILTDDSGIVVSAEFNSIKDNQAVGETSAEHARPIVDLLNRSIDKIRDWVHDLIHKGKVVNNGDSWYFSDPYGYPVYLSSKNNLITPIAQMLLGSATLEQLVNSNKSTDEIIEELKKNKFFEEYFNAWSGFSPISTLNARETFKKLIGHYVYLGTPSNNANDSKHIIIAEDTSEVDSKGKKVHKLIITTDRGKITIETPVNKVGALNKEELALYALRSIMLAHSNGVLTYANPQFDWREMSNSTHGANGSLVNRLIGLVEAGVVRGFKPEGITRKMDVSNPFYKKPAQQLPTRKRPVGGTDTMDNNGGKLNSEGDPNNKGKSIETQALGELSDKVKRAQEIVADLQRRAKEVKLNGDTGYQDQRSGTSYGRVTQVEHAVEGTDALAYESNDNGPTIPTAMGNTMDNLYRVGLEVLNRLAANGKSVIDTKTLYKEIVKDPVFNGKIPNHRETQVRLVLKEMVSFYQLCQAKGWHLVPHDIRVFGALQVTRGGKLFGTLNIAGTLDILVYDNEGKFHIIDMKTKLVDGNTNLKFEDSKAGWTEQINIYKTLLQQMYPDMEFGENYIMPIGVSYNSTLSKPEIGEDGMTIKNVEATSAPKMLPSIQQTDPHNLDNYFLEIEDRGPRHLDYDSLSDADKAKVVPITTLQQTEENKDEDDGSIDPPHFIPPRQDDSGNKEDNGLDNEIKNDVIQDEDEDENEDEGDYSKRSARQSRFTDFINNRIAEVTKPKLNIVAKAINKIKGIITHTGYIDRIIRQDLANTFFNGDLLKFTRICGETINAKTMPLVIEAIRNYYSTYYKSREWYSKNIYNRHHATRLLYDLLNNTITQQQFEELIASLDLDINSVPEVVEYYTALNKQQAAKVLLEKLNTSKLHTEESFKAKSNEMNKFMDSFEAKLDFLNSEMAVLMLTNRATSIRQSILSNQLLEMEYYTTQSLEDLLKGKQGNYGALKLLEGISRRSNNRQFRKLAVSLLKEIRKNKLTLNITLDEGLITDIEGVTNGLNITIHKTAIDSYAHLERVLLHEMIHAVVKTSTEMQALLLEHLDATINQLMKVSGLTREQIIKQHYGLTNVHEFISEYFTNLAFQESLKSVYDISDTFNSVYDRVIHSIKNFFTGLKSIYDEVSPIMESLIGTQNLESTNKQKVKNKTSFVKKTFNELNKSEKESITLRGITATEYNNLPSTLLEMLKKCSL